jgi:hypothetical protein
MTYERTDLSVKELEEQAVIELPRRELLHRQTLVIVLFAAVGGGGGGGGAGGGAGDGDAGNGGPAGDGGSASVFSVHFGSRMR